MLLASPSIRCPTLGGTAHGFPYLAIDHTEYQVDCRFARQRIKLRYSPDLSDIFVVEADGTLTPVRLLDKHANSTAKREKTYLSRGDS